MLLKLSRSRWWLLLLLFLDVFFPETNNIEFS